MSNDYGSVVATVNVNPDVNALKHGALNHKTHTLRSSLQRKANRGGGGIIQNGSQNGHYIDEDAQSEMTI